MEFERSLLDSIAQEMNEVMGIEPEPLDPTKMSDEELTSEIVRTATGDGQPDQAIRQLDFVNPREGAKTFTDQARQFFVNLGVWDEKAKKAIIPKRRAAAKTEAVETKTEAIVDISGSVESSAETEKKETKEEDIMTPRAAEAIVEPVAKTKRAAKKAKAVKAAAKKVTPKAAAPKAAAKKVKAVKTAAAVDEFGYREGSKVSEALKLFKTGKYTHDEVKKQVGAGGHFHKILKGLKASRVKVTTDENGKIKVG